MVKFMLYRCVLAILFILRLVKSPFSLLLSYDVSFVAFFVDIITMTSLKLHHDCFFKVLFRYKQFENHNLAKSRNYRPT